MWNYATEEEALNDVLRLSRGMTFKAAITGLKLGGGKAVIIGDAKTQKNEALMRSFGKFVQTLGGKYITAEDVGMGTEDMVLHQKRNKLRYRLARRKWVATEIPHPLPLTGCIWA
jgi:leucine dehydrogenase